MTKIIASLLPILLLVFLGCGKKINLPNELEKETSVRFHLSGIPSERNEMYVLVTAVKENGDTIFSNRKISVMNEQGRYTTKALPVNASELVITKFLVFYSADSIYLANPKTGSIKEKSVSKALPIKFNIQKNSENQLSVPVTAVDPSENAAAYGYHQTEFGSYSTIPLLFHLSVKVGKIWYDSLPGLLTIRARYTDGQIWTREIQLSEGLTRINIPSGLKEYELDIEKWGVIMHKKLNENTIHSGDHIHLTAEKEARYLISESVFIDNGAGYIPDSKKYFFYDTYDRIEKTLYYQRSASQQEMALTFQSNFRYHSGNKWDTILRYNAAGELVGYLSRTFNNDKVISAQEKNYDYYTNADYSYHTSADRNEVNATYRFSNGNSLDYKMYFKKGNNIQDKATSSTGSIESGNYLYDTNINPFYQLDFDDLFLSGHSKNNVISSSKLYFGSFPAVVPYHVKYSYTEDGYPSEVIISYKGYTSQKHSFRMKKIYQYR
ncbi:hypothetical protein [Sediminibacterium sp. KACHI17]